MRRLAAMVAVVALFGAACGKDKTTSTATTTTTAAAATSGAVTVQVDGKPADLSMSALAYFPQAVTVHAGDKVTFHSNDTGEPHTVTLGTIIDTSLKAFNALPDAIKNADAPPDAAAIAKLPADQQQAVKDAMSVDDKLPALLPDGPGDANQIAANPCFLATGDPVKDTACAKVAPQPAFDGKQSVYSSGYLSADATFDVTLASDIAPGTYNYMCLLHRQGMTGTITVVAKDQTVPTADEVQKAGAKELEDKFASKLRAQATQLATAPADKAVAGAPPLPGQEQLEASLNVFGPTELAAKVGTPVVWTVAGPHTISINAPEDTKGVMTKAPDGSWHANAKTFAPAGGAGAPPPPSGPPAAPDPNAKPVVVDGGTFDGTSFHSSGALLSFGSPTYQYKLTFAKAGSYTVQCQIHPDMKGTVKVS